MNMTKSFLKKIIYRMTFLFALCTVISLSLILPAWSTQPFDPLQIDKFKSHGKWEKYIEKQQRKGTHKFAPHLVEKFKDKIQKKYLEYLGVTTSDQPDLLAQTVPPLYQGGLPSIGSPKIFALLIEFNDISSNISAGDINDMLFGNGNPAAFPIESLKNYYIRSSYGLLDLSNGNTLGWYTAPYNRSEIDETPEGRENLIKEALNYYYSLGHDFEQYDNDGDGDIEYFIVIYAGPNCSPNCEDGDFWWGWYVTWEKDLSYTIDGKTLSHLSWQWESNSPKTVIHETGHAMGLPDLYDYDADVGPDGGVGFFDIMDHEGGHNCFSKWMLDWVEPWIVPNNQQSLTLADSASSTDCVLVWPGIGSGDIFNEFYLVQNRQATGNDSNISFLAPDGLAIWHVDATLNSEGTNFQYDNSFTDHKLIRLMEADGLEEIETAYCNTSTGTCSTKPSVICFDAGEYIDYKCQLTDSNDFYNIGDVLSPNTTPSNARYDGTDSCVRVWELSDLNSLPGEEISATFSANCNDSTGFTVAPVNGLSTTGPQGGTFEPSGQLYVLHNTDVDSINWTATKTQPWLSLSATSGTMTPGAGANIFVSINTNAKDLAPGTYIDTISFTNITNGVGNATREVILIVTPPGVLEVIPADGLTSSGPQWGSFSPSAKTFTLRNVGGSPIGWTVGNAASWVSRDPYGGTLEPGATATVTVSINTNANTLEPGAYNDTISFTNYTNGLGNTTRPVRLTVTPVPGSLFVDPPEGLNSSGDQGSIFAPPYIWYSLTNTGGSAFSWTATKTQPWVTLSATSGTLDLNQSASIQVTINDNAKSLTPGVHTDTISFTNTTNGSGNATRTVTLTVNAVGELSVLPEEAMSSSGPAGGPFAPFSKVYTLTNTGSNSINWTATKNYSQPWLSLSAASGTLASGQSAIVTVSMNSNADNLDPGSYTDAVSFTNTTSHIGDTSRLVNLSVTGGVPGNLEVTPVQGIISSGNQGGPFTPTSQWYLLRNTGQSALSWTATKNLNEPWVSLTATSGSLEFNGANVTIGVIIDADANSLLPGSYLETVTFTNTTNGIGTTNRSVNLTVNPVLTPGTLSVVESDGFTSSGNQGGGFSPHSRNYTLVNIGHTPISWTATKNFGRSWLSLTAISGTLELNGQSQTITVFINEDANSLPASSYNEYIFFTNTTNGMGTTNRTINLTVNPFPGKLLVIETDDYISSGNEGGPFSPPYKAYTLVNSGGTPINWTATKTQPWVSLSETSGILDIHEQLSLLVSINANAGDLEPDVYNDTVSISNTTNGDGNTTRAISLTVNCVSTGQADSDCDGDVDGFDLSVFAEEFELGTNTIGIEEFANNFGW